MKKIIVFILFVLIFAGCSKDKTASSGNTNLTSREVLKKVSPYLENLEYQDPKSYKSINDFYKANLGLEETQVESAVLYMGAPNRNTGYFLMLTKKPETDSDLVLEKLKNISTGWIKTAEQGYLEGNRNFSVIQKGNVFFLVSHYDPGKYTELVELLENL